MKKRGIIVASGECNLEKIEVSKDDIVIAVDGGLQHCRRMGLEPTWIIGDFDSLENHALLADYPKEKIRKLPVEKDDTDTLAALKLGLELGIKDFEIYGALGGRVSHTMANIQSLVFLAKHGATGKLIDKDVEIFVVKNGTYSFTETQTGILSVFALDEIAKGVTISGCKYEVSDVELTNDFPLGVSNEFVGKAGRVRVVDGILLIVIER